MSPSTHSDWTVLVVDDEPGIRELMTAWLAEEYEVRTAADGETALELVDDSVDIALLDRRMPGISGDDLLDELRERGYTFPVAMITAVAPDIDIVDMPFDDYVVKPIAKDELYRIVDLLEKRAAYDEKSRQYFRLASKRAKLRSAEHVDHHTNDEYQALGQEMEQLQTELDDVLTDIADEGLVRAYQQI